MRCAKKALDLAIQTDKVDEFVNQIEYFIESVKAELSDQQENRISMHISERDIKIDNLIDISHVANLKKRK